MLTIENYSVYQGEGTTKRTSKRHQKDNEKTSKGHQKDNERYTKEEVKEKNKNIEEGEEGEEEEKEEKPNLSPLPPLSGFRKVFLNQFGDVAYRTWLEPCEIKETDISVLIMTNDNFRREIIESKYKKTMGSLYRKNIELQEVGH